jgi:hypothetical protein
MRDYSFHLCTILRSASHPWSALRFSFLVAVGG